MYMSGGERLYIAAALTQHKEMTMRARKLIATAGLASGILLLGNVPAMAASGTAWSTDAGDRGASTYYNDNGDSYKVCDEDADYMGAVGWIEVKQADGSWNKFPSRYAGDGNDTCNGNNVDILRESAQVKIVACRQNGPYASPQDCGYIIVPGS